jgi:hypothetical protein
MFGSFSFGKTDVALNSFFNFEERLSSRAYTSHWNSPTYCFSTIRAALESSK